MSFFMEIKYSNINIEEMQKVQKELPKETLKSKLFKRFFK